MIRVRELRFWTTLLVLGLSVATVLLGWPVARLGLAGTGEKRDFVDGAGADVLIARDVVTRQRPADPKAQERDLAALLSLAPLSPGSWLDLAVARRAAGAKTEDVVAALALSSMTGPNEALLMAGRPAFALPFWSALPPDSRRSLIADLVGGWDTIDGEERQRLAAILQNAPDESGEEVKAALLTNGEAGAGIAKALLPAATEMAPAASSTDPAPGAADGQGRASSE